MEEHNKDFGKLTLSQRQRQEWRAAQPYGTLFIGSMVASAVLNIFELWLGVPPVVEFVIAIPIAIVWGYSGHQLIKRRKRRDAEQKAAMEQRWREEDEQLFGQRG
jgi:hypothetical protein